MPVNSRLKATKIIGQREAFYRQRIPGPSCARKETVDIDIFVTSRNDDRKIMQSIRITSRPPSRKRPHFDDEPRVQEKQPVTDQQSSIFAFIACLKIPNSNSGHQPRRDNSFPYMGVWQIYRDTGQPQEKETSQFQFWDNVRTPIQFRKKVNSIILNDFSSRTDPSIFTSIESLLLDRSNETIWVSQHWNQQATSYPSPHCLADQI